MAEVKKPEVPRPAAPAAKSATAVPARPAAVPAKAVPAKTAAVPARAGAVPAKTAAVPARAATVPGAAASAAKPAGVPVKTAATSAAAPARAAAPASAGAAAAPAKTAAAPVKPGLAGKAGTAAATDVAANEIPKPGAAKVATADGKAPGDKDKPATPDTTGATEGEADSQNFEEMRNKFKPAKKSVAVPSELLGDAKSYDDKLILVKILTEKEQSRVVLMVKNMLRSTSTEKKK
jgi:hypothetical protein